jgi:hypothetical protein
MLRSGIGFIELIADHEDHSPSRTKVPYIYTKQYAFSLWLPATRRLVANLLI